MNPATPQIISIQVGLPQTLVSQVPGRTNPERSTQREWVTGFIKEPVFDEVKVTTENLTGDGQADLEHHGGVDKAICVYPTKHYPGWRSELAGEEFPDSYFFSRAFQFGSFGENFTVADLTEENVCIGDVWEVGDTRLQVSQPRQPCWKLARRWEIKDLALRVQNTGRTGWYLRVLQQGTVQSGMSILLIERPHPEWTIARANQLMHHDKTNLQDAAELATLPELSSSWQTTLLKRVEKSKLPDENLRLEGEEK